MQLVSSECIILRSQDYRERDRLVTFLTRQAGRLRGIVKGSRKLTSRGVGDFEPFSCGVMFYTERHPGGLVAIRKCDPHPPYLYLQGDYHKFLYAGYFTELMDLVPIDPAGAEPYFLLLSESLAALCEPGPPRRLPLLRLRFELHFLRLTGYLPDWRRCCVCGAELFRPGAAGDPGTAVTVLDAPHAFDLHEGGMRCPRCTSVDSRNLSLSPGGLAFLENWTRGVSGPGMRPTRQILEELEHAITRHLVHRLERQPRALALLPSLDALDATPPSAQH